MAIIDLFITYIRTVKERDREKFQVYGEVMIKIY